MLEDKPIANKRVRTHDEDNGTITYCNTADYFSGLKEYDYFIGIGIDHSTSTSTRGS